MHRLYKAPQIATKSFLVCVPGHDGDYPTGQKNSQGDYRIGFDQSVKLDHDWKCAVRSIVFNNSYSTFIPKTKMEVVYVVPEVNIAMIEEATKWPDSEMVDIVPGFKVVKLPLTKKDGAVSRTCYLNEGHFFDAEDLINDINAIYKDAGISKEKPLLSLDGDHVKLSLSRNRVEDPWILPIFDGPIRKKLGLPQLLSKNMISLLGFTANEKLEVEIPLKTAINITRSSARPLGLFVSCMNSSIPGLRPKEVFRLSGNRNLDMSDSNVFQIETPMFAPLASTDISVINVQFRDEFEQIAEFPFGTNFVILEFKKGE